MAGEFIRKADFYITVGVLYLWLSFLVNMIGDFLYLSVFGFILAFTYIYLAVKERKADRSGK